MSAPKQYYCCCQHNKKNNETRRTVRNSSKMDNWNARNSSIQMNEILCPPNCAPLTSECSYIETQPDEVTKTAGKINWASGNKKPPTNSKYHGKCVSKKPSKHKLKKSSNIKRNILPSASCTACSTEPPRRKFKNECYCCFPPSKPLLPVKPAVTVPNVRRTIVSGLKSPIGEKDSYYNLETLRKAKNLLQDYVPESEFLKRLQKEAKVAYDCTCNACKLKEETAGLKYTRHRSLLEEAYKDIEREKKYTTDELARQYHKCNAPSSASCCGKCHNFQKSSVTCPTSVSNSKNLTSASLQLSPRTSPMLSPKSSNLFDCDKIHEIKQIRNENYFDTHSSASMIHKDIRCRKCVHKFTLDDRLLPKPVNVDGFGISRCANCNKAMENNVRSNEEVLYTVDYNKLSKPSIEYQRERRLAAGRSSPRTINLPSKCQTIELQVPEILITNRKDIKVNSNKVTPHNSWALRYQKGVV